MGVVVDEAEPYAKLVEEAPSQGLMSWLFCAVPHPQHLEKRRGSTGRVTSLRKSSPYQATWHPSPLRLSVGDRATHPDVPGRSLEFTGLRRYRLVPGSRCHRRASLVHVGHTSSEA